MQLHNSTMVRLLSVNIDGYCNATNPPVLLFLYVKLPFTVKMYDDDYEVPGVAANQERASCQGL
jgi:hypothetical protein